jgi:glucose-6-phosphate 1-dehydrogenase
METMTSTPHHLVIFGATGDLSLRMLLPSLYFLEADGLLPPGLAIVGSARTALDDEQFRMRAHEAVVKRSGAVDARIWDSFARRLHYLPLDAEDPSGFAALGDFLGARGTPRDDTFYLSTSPTLFRPILAQLQAFGIAMPFGRIVIEKPIGHDRASFNAINDAVAAVFPEERVFRVDHYLGKETVQNLLALRFANTLFEPLWNRESIAHVQITVAESVGVEGRWDYYDEYGAMRDMVQNHILQLLCLVAMEPPAKLDPDSVRNEKVKVLRSLRPILGAQVRSETVFGQYRAGHIEGAAVPGYADEAGGHASGTETFVAIEAGLDNWRWAGVPFYLRTGKRLARRRTEIVIQFREVPHSVFQGAAQADIVANRLTFALQPQEEIALLLMNKTAGLSAAGMRMSPLSLNLSLTKAYEKSAPRRRIAYEHLLLEALKGDQTLFVRRDEADAAWTWIDGIADGRRALGAAPEPYAAGSSGPDRATHLIARKGFSWNGL